MKKNNFWNRKLFVSAFSSILFVCVMVLLVNFGFMKPYSSVIESYASVSNPSQIKNISIVLDDNYPPFIFRDSENHIQGILVDQWDLWEKKTGINVTLQAMNWDDAKTTMSLGKADVIDTIFYTEERAKSYDFTKAYADIEVPIFFNANLSGINNAQSIRDFSIGVKKGDAAIDVLKSQGVQYFIYYDNYEQIIEAAKADKLVVFCMDKPPALYFLYKAGILDKFKVTDSLYVGAFHRAVKKGDTALLAVVEEGFSKISQMELDQIDAKWYGTSLQYQDYFKYVLLTFLGVVVVLLFLLMWNRTLNRRVKQKTLALELEMKQSQSMAHALFSSENQSKSLLETTSEGYCLLTPEGKIVEINVALCQLLNVDKAIILNTLILNYIESSDLVAFKQLMNVIQTVHNKTIEVRVITGKEQYRIASFKTTIIEDEAGLYTGFFALVTDVTQQKNAEDNLKAAYNNLENLVQQRTMELSTANTQLIQLNHQMLEAFDDLKRTQEKLIQSEKMSSLAILVAGIAHEINTPVGNAITLSSYLSNSTRDFKKEISLNQAVLETTHEYIQAVEEGTGLLGKNLSRVAELVGYFKQISIDQISESVAWFDLKEFINDVIFGIQAMYKGRTYLIELTCEDGYKVRNYADTLSKVLTQLITNSILHGFTNVVDEKIVINVREEETQYIFTYKDNGKGISEEELPKIFDPFYTSARYQGNIGLGLSVVHNLVTQKLGGAIVAESQLGEGTTFIFSILKEQS